jgi:serine/threonine protein kinase
VLYEMLTGKRPYRSRTVSELLNEISNVEPRPPRQLNDTIPQEFDRICIKALAKRQADRYSTALDFARDLRSVIAPQAQPNVTAPPTTPAAVRWAAAAAVALLVGGLWWAGSDRSRGPVGGSGSPTKLSLPAESHPAPSELKVELKYQPGGKSGSHKILSPTAGPLHTGDNIQVRVRAPLPAYLYVYWYDSEGHPDRLWPADLQHQIKTDRVSIPNDDPTKWLPLDGDPGQEMIFAASSEVPFGPSEIAQFEKQLPFPKGRPPVSSPISLPLASTERSLGKGVVTSESEPVNQGFENSAEAMFKSYRLWVLPHQ